MVFRPATSLLCSSVWCALVTPRLGIDWPLDAPDSVYATTRVRSHSKASLMRPIICSWIGDRSSQFSFLVPLPVGRVPFGHAATAPPRRRRASCPAPASSRVVGLLHLAPPVDQAVQLVGVRRVHAQHPLRVGDVGQSEVDQALLARQRRPQLAGVGRRLVAGAGAEQVHPLHQRVVDLPRVLDRLDRVAVLGVPRLARAVRDVALAEPDAVRVRMRARAHVQAG